MAQTLIGIVYGATTKTPYATIKPTDDSELDNPAWLTIGVSPVEPLTITKVPVATYNSWTSFAQLTAYVAALP